MNTLRDALAHTLGEGDGMAVFNPNYITADAVLAMPELEAVRIQLLVWWPTISDGSFTDMVGLPPSVIAWVLNE
jgi:hypothetical protein